MSHPAPIQRPFVSSLRTTDETIRLGGASSAPTITLRVESNENWHVVRFEVPLDEPVMTVKLAALEALAPKVRNPEGYVLKLHGFEVLDEQATLATIGARDGSILLITSRRRRPVR
ncbi:MAG TPA: EsaB/YukD family protein [Gemmatimonadales bacterium]